MNGEEIRERIILNNQIIEKANKSFFVLDKDVKKALEENEHLRSICDHVYDDLGFCIYCDKERE